MSPEWVNICAAASSLSSAEADRLEERLQQNSSDLSSRVKLIGYYTFRHDSRRHVHINWLIASHPDIDLCGIGNIGRRTAPDAYETAKSLWLAAIARQPADPDVCWSASRFFFVDEPAFAEKFLLQGASLEPKAARWHDALGRLYSLQRPGTTNRVYESLTEYKRATALAISSVERCSALINLAGAAHAAGDLELARQSADTLLAEETSVKGTWIHGNAVHHGNIVLGHLALIDGDIVRASSHLAAAATAPESPQLNSFGPDFSLASALLKSGEAKSVVAYLENCKRFWSANVVFLDRWIYSIERGEIPSFVRWDTSVSD